MESMEERKKKNKGAGERERRKEERWKVWRRENTKKKRKF
jgi:hypothetical protein